MTGGRVDRSVAGLPVEPQRPRAMSPEPSSTAFEGGDLVRRLVGGLPALRPALDEHIAKYDELLSTVFSEDDVLPWLLDEAAPEEREAFWALVEAELEHVPAPSTSSRVATHIRVCFMEVLVHRGRAQRQMMGPRAQELFDHEDA